MRKKECPICRRKIEEIDYQDVALLSRYQNNWGKIKVAQYTGVCGKHQRKVSEAIKRARFLALLPYTNR